jgi:6-phosphogluconate dehydrogenase
MGVSGCGKSTIGSLLSKKINIPFFDGDDFHPDYNIEKMFNGQALNDEDRQGWLVALNALAKKQLINNSSVIVCSALKQKYRDILSKGIEQETQWVYLSGSFEIIYERMNSRANHFMPATLLKSQFDTLEEPKNALEINSGLKPKEIIEKIIENLDLKIIKD